MLTMARESRAMTQADVADAMTKAGADAGFSASQGYVSRAESGRLKVSGERLELYGAALGYPVQLLCLDPQVSGVGIGLVHHRKRASLPVTVLRRIHAQLALTRVQVEGLAEAAPPPPAAHGFPAVELDDLTLPKDAARQVRKAWRMAPGPVPDMIGALESAGALVVMRDLDSDRLDAVSQWDGQQAPLLLVSDHAPADRCRFSLAHELGHLVMHHSPGTGASQEKEADAFAAEFLMPAADIRQALAGGVDLPRLADLKRQWKVSMAALLRRAQTLGAITDWQYRGVAVEMSTLGYRTAEPIPVSREHPRRVPQIIATAREHGASVHDLAACARLLPEDFLHLYAPPSPAATPVSEVRP